MIKKALSDVESVQDAYAIKLGPVWRSGSERKIDLARVETAVAVGYLPGFRR